MLSNQTLKTLETKLGYLQTQIRGLKPHGLKIIGNELSKVKAQITEAKNRNVVGETKDGELVYLAPSEFTSTDNEILYIEGLPSGWDSTAFEIESGLEYDVIVDAGQNWSTSFTIY